MGRVKITIKKIEKLNCRKVAFAKRRAGLVKKGYELSVLSDVQAVLIAFSPSNKLCPFSHPLRLEDVLIRYIKMPEAVHAENQIVIDNKDEIIALLENIKLEDDHAAERRMEEGSSSSSSKPKTSEDDMQVFEDVMKMPTKRGSRLDTLKKILMLIHTDKPILNARDGSVMSYEQISDYCYKELYNLIQDVRNRKDLVLAMQNMSANISYEPQIRQPLPPVMQQLPQQQQQQLPPLLVETKSGLMKIQKVQGLSMLQQQQGSASFHQENNGNMIVPTVNPGFTHMQPRNQEIINNLQLQQEQVSLCQIQNQGNMPVSTEGPSLSPPQIVLGTDNNQQEVKWSIEKNELIDAAAGNNFNGGSSSLNGPVEGMNQAPIQPPATSSIFAGFNQPMLSPSTNWSSPNYFTYDPTNYMHQQQQQLGGCEDITANFWFDYGRDNNSR